MRILIISPFDGGSHHAWANGFKKYSQNDVTILSLPDRFWKWRMHGGSVTLARQFMNMVNSEGDSSSLPDVILATDMLDLTTFLALTRAVTATIPTILFMHENQLTYPLPADPGKGPMRRQKGERDLHYAFINYASMLSANLVLFNSQYHSDAWFEELPRFLNHFPEYKELETVELIQSKSDVLPIGVEIEALLAPVADRNPDDPPLILWNQRWEYDKNPDQFFKAIYAISQKELPFRLAVCGENFRQIPSEFNIARSQLSEYVVHWGYATKAEYRRLLQDAAITISTADHEYFGLSIVEAMACKTFPILPNRLSYPEIVPTSLHDRCLYTNFKQLLSHLEWSLVNETERSAVASLLAIDMKQYNWPLVAGSYDTRISQIVGELS